MVKGALPSGPHGVGGEMGSPSQGRENNMHKGAAWVEGLEVQA